MLLSTLILEDNNPNQLPMIALILAIVFIVYCLISAKMKIDKKNRLEAVRRKIIRRHDQLRGDVDGGRE